MGLSRVDGLRFFLRFEHFYRLFTFPRRFFVFTKEVSVSSFDTSEPKSSDCSRGYVSRLCAVGVRSLTCKGWSAVLSGHSLREYGFLTQPLLMVSLVFVASIVGPS